VQVPHYELFPRAEVVGVFHGFREGGMEFHADLVLPYQSDFQNRPMHGQFLLVQLETPDEAVVGRITAFSSEGKLASGPGEEFNIRAMQEGRAVPEDLRAEYLRYRVNIRVLGVLRRSGDDLAFVPSHRRLPHVGSPVAFPSAEVLRKLVGHHGHGAAIGHYALGEYVYAEGSDRLDRQDWMQIRSPEILARFPIESLVSRRSFIFARAGFGKSNLTKLLFSTLYRETPTVPKRGGEQVPVGTVIFDPEGEYFWPDDKGRPGLCDVPHLEDKLVVFTSRQGPSPFYASFVAGGVKLDIRRLKASDVVAIALPPEKQDQQNVAKLRGLPEDRWRELVDLVQEHRHAADLEEISRLLQLDKNRQEAEAIAARSNMATIVQLLHDPSSLLMDRLIAALAAGKLCVVDVSQLRGSQAMILCGLILRRIFERNQEEFTKAQPRTIPTIAVIEEAQTVLNERASAAEPYIAWVKEGRKYDLGAVLITQQPGSIPHEILSQGDNWFIFHLLSAGDLVNLRKANAHFSDDVLSGILNEPIPGQGVFWSSAARTPYPIAMRVFSYERMYEVRDPHFEFGAARTYAAELRRRFDRLAVLAHHGGDVTGTNGREQSQAAIAGEEAEDLHLLPDQEGDGKPLDVVVALEDQAIAALGRDADLMAQLQTDGVPWGRLKAFFLDRLPVELEDRDEIAYRLVPKAMDRIFGKGSWSRFKNPSTNKVWVKGVLERA